MLPVSQRLRRRPDFAAAIRSGRRSGRGPLVVHLATSESAVHPARVGFVVPRAVGNAVERNLVRRRLRHLMRPRLDAMPTGTSVVVRVLPGAASRNSDRLAEYLDAALRRVVS